MKNGEKRSKFLPTNEEIRQEWESISPSAANGKEIINV